jgi:hypothetical protein
MFAQLCITGWNWFLNPILFVLPFKFVKYITKCIKKLQQMTFGINKPLKEGLALKVKPKIK